MLRTLVESLSAERYCLESMVNSVSQPAIPGQDFGSFMKEVFPLPDATLIDSFGSERIGVSHETGGAYRGTVVGL